MTAWEQGVSPAERRSGTTPILAARSSCRRRRQTIGGVPGDELLVVTPPGDVAPETEAPGTQLFDYDGEMVPSGAISSLQGGRVVLVADTHNGELLTWAKATGAFRALDVGAEPTRLLRVGDDIFVTLRASGEIAHIVVDRDGPRSRGPHEPSQDQLSVSGGSVSVCSHARTNVES